MHQSSVDGTESELRDGRGFFWTTLAMHLLGWGALRRFWLTTEGPAREMPARRDMATVCKRRRDRVTRDPGFSTLHDSQSIFALVIRCNACADTGIQASFFYRMGEWNDRRPIFRTRNFYRSLEMLPRWGADHLVIHTPTSFSISPTQFHTGSLLPETTQRLWNSCAHAKRKFFNQSESFWLSPDESSILGFTATRSSGVRTGRQMATDPSQLRRKWSVMELGQFTPLRLTVAKGMRHI